MKRLFIVLWLLFGLFINSKAQPKNIKAKTQPTKHKMTKTEVAKYTLKLLDPSIEILKVEPAQPVEGEMTKVYFTFTNWTINTSRNGIVAGGFEGVSRDPSNTNVNIDNLAYKGTVSDVIILKTPKVGESTKIGLIYYETEAIQKVGFRKRVIASAEIDVDIAHVFITKRISGKTFFTFQKGDNADSYGDNNGYLTVYHNPGCGIVGNDGTDKFFVNRPLPPGCTILKTEYTQFWPVNRNCDDPWSWFDDAGSYNANYNPNNYSIRWHNSCRGAYNGKNIIYTISYIISLPLGMDIGETLYDVGVTSPSAPGGYSRIQAAKPPYCDNYKNIGYGVAPYLVIDGPFHTPEDLVEKKPFSISYNVINAGTADMASTDVTLYLDNGSESSKTIPKLKPNESTIIKWDVTKELTGFSHSFELKGQGGSSLSYAVIVFVKAPDPQ